MKKYQQFVFSWRSEEEKLRLIAALEAAGYAGVNGNMAEEPASNHVPVFCADEKSHSFYYINACCAAALAQAGRPFYKADDCEAVFGKTE